MQSIDRESLDIKEWALKTHNNVGSLYDGHSYRLHLEIVEATARRFDYLLFPGISYKDTNTMRRLVYSACWCHDLIEDCRVTYNDLVKKTGSQVLADWVYAVTSELGHNRKERNEFTYPKTAQSKVAIFIKLCDRIANTVYSKYWNSQMFDKYRLEYPGFKAALRIDNDYDPMWDELDQLYGAKRK